jgi:hypothetical protein
VFFGYLRSLARELGPSFEESYSQVLQPEWVQGLHLTIDRLWLEWAWLEIGYHAPWSFATHGVAEPRGFRILSLLDFQDRAEEWIQKHRPNWWKDYLVQTGREGADSPVQFRIIFRSTEAIQGAPQWSRSFRGHPVIAEVHPPCVALVNPGDNVGQNSPITEGTLGGFLYESATGKYYAVTCAHVCAQGKALEHPSPAKSSKKQQTVGVASHAVLAPPNLQKGCTNRSHATPDALDMALAPVATGILPNLNFPSLPKPSLVTQVSTMTNGDQVVIFGARSGQVDAEISSLCIYHEIDVSGQKRCFGDIVSLTHRRPWYFNTKLVDHGDSGAWILSQLGGVTAWDGMVFAGDGATAYACFAENIFNESRRVIGHSVVLPP